MTKLSNLGRSIGRSIANQKDLTNPVETMAGALIAKETVSTQLMYEKRKEQEERMSKDEKCCLNCKIFWDKEHGCEECRFEHKDHPSLFYRITASPEVLAEKLVFNIPFVTVGGASHDRWYSTIEPFTEDVYYYSREKAIAATVAKLKEWA